MIAVSRQMSNILQLYHDSNMLHFNEITMITILY